MRIAAGLVVFWSIACGGGRGMGRMPSHGPPQAPPRPEEPVVRGPFRPGADPCAAAAEPGLHELDTAVPGRPGETLRSLIWLPPGPGPHDVVVLLHGGDNTPMQILGQTRFPLAADPADLIVVAPPAAQVRDHGPHWSSGKFDSVLRPEEERDDVALLDALAAEVKKDACGRRVLAAGFSSGGQMAHRWGCQGTEPDAIVSAAGTLLVPPASCRGPKPILSFIGTADPVYDAAPLAGTDQPSAQQTMELWAKINRCDGSPPASETRGDAACRVWHGCAAPTELCVVSGFPHGWPEPWFRSHPTRVDATAEAIRFFGR